MKRWITAKVSGITLVINIGDNMQPELSKGCIEVTADQALVVSTTSRKVSGGVQTSLELASIDRLFPPFIDTTQPITLRLDMWCNILSTHPLWQQIEAKLAEKRSGIISDISAADLCNLQQN